MKFYLKKETANGYRTNKIEMERIIKLVSTTKDISKFYVLKTLKRLLFTFRNDINLNSNNIKKISKFFNLKDKKTKERQLEVILKVLTDDKLTDSDKNIIFDIIHDYYIHDKLNLEKEILNLIEILESIYNLDLKIIN